MDDTIDQKQYNTMYNVYARTGSVAESARVAQLGPQTARRYILGEGSARFPPIAKEVERAQELASIRLRRRHADVIAHTRTAALMLLGKSASQVPKIEYKPKGKENPDGSVVVNVHELRHLTAAMQQALNLSLSADSALSGRIANDGHVVNINVNSNGVQDADGAEPIEMHDAGDGDFSSLSPGQKHQKRMDFLKRFHDVASELCGTGGSQAMSTALIQGSMAGPPQPKRKKKLSREERIAKLRKRAGSKRGERSVN